MATFIVFTPTAQAVDGDDEGGSAGLRKKLDEASRGYNDAKNKLDNSKKRQGEVNQQLESGQKEVDELTGQVSVLANAAYKSGSIGGMNAILDAGSTGTLMEKMSFIDQISWDKSHKITELRNARKDLDRQKKQLEKEIEEQTKQQDEMAKRRADAEKALEEVGGGNANGPGGGKATAVPAPRNANGGWPSESCSVDDPTTGLCLTPRTLHALKQAQAAGFTRYVRCKRAASFGEHPKGRACDFAAAKNTFGPAATGDDKTYGNNLAAWFLANSSRLGVMYVIWYRKIWMPSTGWRNYQSGSDPAAAHTNHVHLSML